MFRKSTLNNRLTVLTESMESVRSVAVGIWLKRGSRHERADEGGLAHFIEHMVFKGTERRSQAAIAQEMDSIGGQTDAFTTQEYAGFHAKVLDEHVPQALDLLSDIVLAPRFEPEELERERMVILEEIKSVDDNPEELVHDLFGEAFWAGHPLGRPILGKPADIEAFSRGDISRFFRKTYAPSNILVAAAGRLEHERILSLVEGSFSELSAPPDGHADTPPRSVAHVGLHEKDLELAHLVLGSEAPAQASPDRHTAYVLDAILGGNLSSRLFQVIREERGLAYTVYSGLSAFSDAGEFSIYAGTDPRNVAEVIDLVLRELRRIQVQPVEADELRRAKDHLRGSILLGLESTNARMSQLARQEMYYGCHVSAEQSIRGIEAVRAEDVSRLAARMFGSRPLAMTILGRLDQMKSIPESLVA